MAITKFVSQLHPQKSGDLYAGVRKLLEYILNPEKTEGKRYVGSLNCSADAEKALQEIAATKKYFGKERRDPHHRLAYHWVLSWTPKENISEAEALKITQEFCEKYFGENYEAVYSVHNDRKHMHAHICFNSVNRMDGYMYRYNSGDWAKNVQPLVDSICEKNGYHTLEMDTGMSLEEYYREHIRPKKERTGSRHRNNSGYQKEDSAGSGKRYSAMEHIKKDIDMLVLEVNSYEQLLGRMRDMGYLVRAGKNLTLQPKGAAVRIRTFHIGDEYTVEAIKERIAQPEQHKKALREKLQEREGVPDVDVAAGPCDRMEYLFSFRLQHMKYIPMPLTRYQKRNYYRMYRYSVKRAGKRVSYSQINKSLANIRKLEEEINLADAYGIESVNQIKDIRDKMYQALKMADVEERKVIKKRIAILWRIEEGLKDSIPPDIDNRVDRILDIVNSKDRRKRKEFALSRAGRKKYRK